MPLQRRFHLWFPIRRLRWRLTFSYTLVTVSAVFIIQVLGMVCVGLVFFLTDLFPQAVAIKASEIAPQFGPSLSASPANKEALTFRLKQLQEELETPGKSSRNGFGFGLSASSQQTITLAVTNAEGRTVACAPENALPVGDMLEERLSTESQTALKEALNRETDVERLSLRESNGGMIMFAPIMSDEPSKKMQGVFFVRINSPFEWRTFLTKTIAGVLPTTAFIAVFAGVVGTIFGFLSARKLTERLGGISTAANAWSRGDFAAQCPEQPDDELGRLAARLNVMARELQNFVVLRQDLAMAEERNRLARDLHDTVKQHVFSCAMQLGAIRTLLVQDVNAAAARLTEVENLIHRIQRELTEVLNELKPNACNLDLVATLRDYVDDWTKQTGIKAEFDSIEYVKLKQDTSQTLFRITQEALANVARHSKASKVHIRFYSKATGPAQRAIISIEDDGCGFELSFTPEGMGLRNMRDRAASLPHGQLVLESSKDCGTKIIVSCDANGESQLSL